EAPGGGAADEATALDEEHADAEPRGRRRRCDAGRAAADDDDIRSVGHRERAGRLPEGSPGHAGRPVSSSAGCQVDLPRAATSASHACSVRMAWFATSMAVSTPSLTKVSVTRLAATAHTLPPRSP